VCARNGLPFCGCIELQCPGIAGMKKEMIERMEGGLVPTEAACRLLRQGLRGGGSRAHGESRVGAGSGG
jgi:hypothetical protein